MCKSNYKCYAGNTWDISNFIRNNMCNPDSYEVSKNRNSNNLLIAYLISLKTPASEKQNSSNSSFL